MDVSKFDYVLPKELIAQNPKANRTESRLMMMGRSNGAIKHTTFSHIIDYLRPSDVLVLNDTRVRHARLMGNKKETGAKVELLLLKPLTDGLWEALVKPARRIKEGSVVVFGNGELVAIAKEEMEIPGGRVFHLQTSSGKDIEAVIEEVGQTPLPPYIQEELYHPSRYQTVYSKNMGSAAAPTAGLHFTSELLNEIEHRGIELVYVTLHVGLGTFRPVTAEKVSDHQMHAEYYEISQRSAEILQRAKKSKRRIVAVGTTSVRTLESVAKRFNGNITPCTGWTDIFIYPGYSFQIVDALITNFHLPRSTLLMLVSAFSTRERVLWAYQQAINEKYRFFSFGDAMFLY